MGKIFNPAEKGVRIVPLGARDHIYIRTDGKVESFRMVTTTAANKEKPTCRKDSHSDPSIEDFNHLCSKYAAAVSLTLDEFFRQLDAALNGKLATVRKAYDVYYRERNV